VEPKESKTIELPEKCTKASDLIRLNTDSSLNRTDEINLQYEKHDEQRSEDVSLCPWNNK
jgi:hypothetical protein